MDRNELDFYRIRFKTKVYNPQTAGSTAYTWRETNWMDHLPTFRDIITFLQEEVSTYSIEILNIEMEHEHYIREKKETL